DPTLGAAPPPHKPNPRPRNSRAVPGRTTGPGNGDGRAPGHGRTWRNSNEVDCPDQRTITPQEADISPQGNPLSLHNSHERAQGTGPRGLPHRLRRLGLDLSRHPGWRGRAAPVPVRGPAVPGGGRAPRRPRARARRPSPPAAYRLEDALDRG